MSLDAKEWIYWECNECSIMFPHLTVPKKCHCGNNLESNSTKKRLVLTFHIKEFIEELDNICINEEFRQFCKDYAHAPTSELEKYICWSKMKMKELAGDKLTKGEGGEE